ncbi:MAG: [protein-PII] uridylyltransferase [Planctomycetaceae bacterium]
MTVILPPIVEQLPARLLAQKAQLQLLRDQARERYAGGAPGLQVATLICDAVERLILDIFNESLARLTDADRERMFEHSAIVAIGGTGRGELAPYSDADLLFLHSRGCPPQLSACIAQAVRDCWDAGIKLGHSVRTPGDALAAAMADPQFATALVEARRLWGAERLVATFQARFQRRVVRNRFARFYNDCLAARRSECAQYGASDRQLEPDVKRSPGGLRDIHLIRWIGFAAYGTPDIDLLRRQGALSREDADALVAAQEFITRIRVDLHFSAGKPQETLTREEQLRLARLFGVAGTAGQRPVERFMQMYFRHSTGIAAVAERFVARHRPRPWNERIWRSLASHRSNGIFRVAGNEIDVRARDLDRVCGSLDELLNLYKLAGLYSAKLSPDLTEQVRLAVPRLGRDLSPEAGQSFLAILRATGHVGELLRSLFATGLLEIVLPEMSHARCLLQFNQYHAYTVDEHSLRAVEAAEQFDVDSGPIGTAYRAIRHKEVLHLALLLHDLGKGFERDHSEVGRDIAQATAARLRLSAPHTEMLAFLVHKHLMMAHLALRRDLNDVDLLVRFSRDVGSPELLRMLYVLTAADISAVGPGAWTSWKAELLTSLFERALPILSGVPPRFRESETVQQVCRSVHQMWLETAPQTAPSAASGPADAADPGVSFDLDGQLRALPLHYLTAVPPPQVVADLRDVAQILRGNPPLVVRGEFDGAREAVEYQVVTRDKVGSGLFSKITGALTAKGLQILSANICTSTEGVVIDRFRVVDGDHVGTVPDYRLREVETAISDVLTGRATVEQLFQRHRRLIPRAETLQLFREPTRVVIDNDSSERFTIIDVFANDRRGLLYTIAAALFDLRLSVSLAKIATHLDQVLDVFYVTDHDGGKLQDSARLDEIRATLAARIDGFERRGLATP